MIPYFSPTAEVRADKAARAAVADALDTFGQIAARDGWSEAAGRVNRWAANNYDGNWQDPTYDRVTRAEIGDVNWGGPRITDAELTDIAAWQVNPCL